MARQAAASTRKGRVWRTILVGFVAAIPGIHFFLGAVAAGVSRRNPFAGAVAVVLAFMVAYFLGGLEGALVFIAVTTGIVLSFSRSLSRATAVSVTAALAVIASAVSLLDNPGLMGMDSGMLETLVPLYSSAGIPVGQIRGVIDSMIYLSPGIGSLQITMGSLLAVVFFGMLHQGGDRSREDVRLDLLPAWIVIVALAACIAGPRLGAGDIVLRAACNLLLFMAAPYGIVGFLVLAEATRGKPMLSFLALMLVFAATPLALAAVVLTGVLDTWFDFRKRIRSAGMAGGGST